jgi:chemotaxis protein histidine kinase CheA
MDTDTEKTNGAAPEAPKGVTPPTGGRRSGFLSDVIVELGFASREAIEEAVRAAASPGTTVARALVDMGAISEEQLAHATAERHGVDYVDLSGFDVDPAAANLIRPTAARRYRAVPVAYVNGGLLVAMADPADTLAVNDIAVMTNFEVRPAVAASPALDALLEALPLDEAGVEWPAEPAPAPAQAPPPPAPPPPSTGDAPQLRGELELLKKQLAGAEANLKGNTVAGDEDGEVEELRGRLAATEVELEETRVRLRDAKDAGAELESLRRKLQTAEAALAEASAPAPAGESAAAEADELRTQVTSLRQERDEVRSELRLVGADAEVRAGELESLRAKLTDAETELVRVRAEADARGSEVDAVRARAESAENEAAQALRRASESETDAEAAHRRATEAEQQAEEARARAAQLERTAADVKRLTAELAAADARAEQARQALVELRAEHDREREQSAAAERDLREKLGQETRRRSELESRLAEVEGAALAAEQSFEELRLAQGRMRGALRDGGQTPPPGGGV